MKPYLLACSYVSVAFLSVTSWPAAARGGAEADTALKPLAARFADAQADRQRLRRDLLSFRQQYPGTPAYLRAAELLAQLPSALDKLDPARIDAEDRWEGQPKELAAVLKGHSRAAAAIAFSPGGEALASTGWENKLRLWKFGGAAPQEWATLQGSPSGLAFSPDGRTLAAGTPGQTVLLWDLSGATPREQTRLGGHVQRPFAVAWSPDGRMLATGCLDPRLRVWKFEADGPEAWAVLAGEKVATQAVSALAFSPDGKRLAAGGFIGNQNLHLWDVGGATMDDVDMPEAQAQLVVFSPDGSLASHGMGGGIRLWDVRATPPKEKRVLGGAGDTWTALAFSLDGRVLASAGQGRKVVLWQPASGKTLQEWQLPAEPKALAFAPDGRHLAVAAADGAVYILRRSAAK